MPTLGTDTDIKLTNSALTEGAIAGNGVFDVLMRASATHLKNEFDAGRITGDQYTKAYIALIEACMAGSIQFLLGREKTYWDARVSRLQAEEALPAEIANLTKQGLLLTEQTQNAATEGDIAAYNLANLLPKQVAKIDSDILGATKDNDIKAYNLTNLLPEQLKLVKEQAETARSQTLDTRFDGAAVTGSVGKQKALYDQQVTSYQRDAEVKAAKMFIDSWITQKSIDEGLLAPTTLQNASVDAILADIKTNNSLG